MSKFKWKREPALGDTGRIFKYGAGAVTLMVVLMTFVFGFYYAGQWTFTTALTLGQELPFIKGQTQPVVSPTKQGGVSSSIELKSESLPASVPVTTVPNQLDRLLIPSAKPGKPDFFSDYRLDREKVRSQQLELLREIVNNAQSGNEARQEAQTRILQISKDMQKETEAERLILSKGFQDVVVFIQSSHATVVVKADGLGEKEKTSINDIVSRVTGVAIDKIDITLNK